MKLTDKEWSLDHLFIDFNLNQEVMKLTVCQTKVTRFYVGCLSDTTLRKGDKKVT